MVLGQESQRQRTPRSSPLYLVEIVDIVTKASKLLPQVVISKEKTTDLFIGVIGIMK